MSATTVQYLLGDCLEHMRAMSTDSVDLVVCSPPYVDCRTYGIGFKLVGQDWVDWSVARFVECVRVCRGMVVWVVEGKTKKFRWDATPALLIADLHRAGVHLRKPPAFVRVGIPGSGGPDWFRNDWEWCICGSKGGKLPWSDNTAMGHPPKWAPGGEMANRTTTGARVNQRGGTGNKKRPSHVIVNGRDQFGGTPHASSGEGRKTNGEHKTLMRWGEGGDLPPETKTGDAIRRLRRLERGNEDGSAAVVPVLANPGNILRLIVGGGAMGSKIAHENEAPLPEGLPEFFIRSCCPPGGIVLDCFGGSGTTMSVAIQHGRSAIVIDIRESQIELCKRREAEARAIVAAGGRKPKHKPKKRRAPAKSQSSMFEDDSST